MQAEKYISDEVLIRRVLEGQQEDFTLLVERHASPLLHFVGRMIPVREEAEEIVQDTLLAAYQRLNDFDSNNKNGGSNEGATIFLCLPLPVMLLRFLSEQHGSSQGLLRGRL